MNHFLCALFVWRLFLCRFPLSLPLTLCPCLSVFADSALHWSAFHLLCNSLHNVLFGHGFVVLSSLFEFDSWFYVSLFMIRWPFFSLLLLLPLFSALLIFGSALALWKNWSCVWVCVSRERNCPDEWMKLIRLWSTYGLCVCVFLDTFFEIRDAYTERNVLKCVLYNNIIIRWIQSLPKQKAATTILSFLNA